MGGSFDRSKMGKSHGCTDPVPNLSRLASASASGKFRRMDVDRVRYISWKNGLKIRKGPGKKKKKSYMFLKTLIFTDCLSSIFNFGVCINVGAVWEQTNSVVQSDVSCWS